MRLLRRTAALVLLLAGVGASGCQRDKTVTQSGLTGIDVTVSYDPALRPSSLAISGTVDGAPAFTPGALPGFRPGPWRAVGRPW